MKTKIYGLGIATLLMIVCNKTNAQNVNTSLSNLVSPTAVNVHLLPDKDNKRDLGSANKSWRNIYLDGSVYLGGARFLTYSVGSGTANTAVGSASLNANTTGYSNTGVGFNALFNNTTGYSNIAVGIGALKNNISGYQMIAIGDSALYTQTSNNWLEQNIAVGSKALFNNTSGGENSAFGFQTLLNNTTGYRNTAVGFQVLMPNTIGNDNTGVGTNALTYNTTGSSNTGVGLWALGINTTGSGNTAVGDAALGDTYTGNYNTALGSSAGYFNNGSHNVFIGDNASFWGHGSNNVAVGTHALFSNTSGSNLIAIGDSTLYTLSGNHCTAVGSKAGVNNTTGNNNTYLGYHAGNTVTTGSSNTIIGYGADVNNGTWTNASAIGNLAVVGASNHVHIGNSSVTSIGGQVDWTSFSDERIKTNIKYNVPGLAFINLLKPVTYNFDLNKQSQLTGRKDSTEWKEKYDIQKINFTGFLAQEVEAAAKKIGYDFSGVDAAKNEHDLYGLRYAEFVVPLVKAVQELSKMNDNKDEKINNLQKEIDELKVMMIANAQSNSLSQSSSVTLSNASLEQNIPNPFNHTTTIHYTLPQKFSSAQIIITDNTGKTLKQINISGTGKGSVNVDASMLSAGAYNYSLIVDGKLIAAKQMVLTK